MIENFKQVKVEGLAKMVFPDDRYILLLSEIYGTRKLPVMLNEEQANLARLIISGNDSAFEFSMHRVLLNFAWKRDARFSRAEVFRVKDGEFMTRVWMKSSDREDYLHMHITNAIALAIIERAPIYVLDAILDSEHMHDLGNGQYSLPATSVSDAMLEEALQDAIKKEKYELASQLRDEIRKRKEKKK